MDATGHPTSPSARPASFWISLAVLSAVIFVYVLLMSNRGGDTGGTSGPAIGRSLGYLQLEPLTGPGTSVGLADLQGRVTLLNFWGTWCPPCIRELPQIEELAERYSSQEDFRLYAVSCGQSGDERFEDLRAETEAFLKSRDSSLATYADQNAATRQALAIKLSIPLAYPTTLIFDRQGRIRGFWQGYDSSAPEEMGTLVQELLAERPLN